MFQTLIRAVPAAALAIVLAAPFASADMHKKDGMMMKEKAMSGENTMKDEGKMMKEKAMTKGTMMKDKSMSKGATMKDGEKMMKGKKGM